MSRILPYLLTSTCLLLLPVGSLAADHELRNTTTTAEFGPDGLLSLEDTGSHSKIDIARDAWLMVIGGTTLSSTDTKPTIHKTAKSEITYDYKLQGYRIQVVYKMKQDWRFVGKQIEVLSAPNDRFTVHRIVPWDIGVRSTVVSEYVPSTYVPQFGES